MTAAMTLPPELLQRLADIEPPPPPAGHPLLFSAGLALILLGLLWIGRRMRRPLPPRRAALRRLRQLERQWREGQWNDRETAYRLAAILRLGLEDGPSCASRAQEWQHLMTQLAALRYPSTPRGAVSEALFHSARRCLQQADPPGAN